MDVLLFAIAGFAALIAAVVVRATLDDGDHFGAFLVGGVAALAVIATFFYALVTTP